MKRRLDVGDLRKQSPTNILTFEVSDWRYVHLSIRQLEKHTMQIFFPLFQCWVKCHIQIVKLKISLRMCAVLSKSYNVRLCVEYGFIDLSANNTVLMSAMLMMSYTVRIRHIVPQYNS